MSRKELDEEEKKKSDEFLQKNEAVPQFILNNDT